MTRTAETICADPGQEIASMPTQPKVANPQDESLVVVELQEPPHYRVVLHNDDYTPMDFVVAILCAVFHKSREDAVRVMLAVHEQGRGDCGIYPAEIAETKISIVHGKARASGFPLRCSLEDV